jgi:GNAT superfamily N-acetyltransferase
VSEVVTVRPAVPTDASAIRQLTRDAYAKSVPVIGREPKPMTADYAEASRKHRIDLLYVDEALAALIETIPQIDHLLIENVAVSPPFQRRGLGRKLMAHAERVRRLMVTIKSGSTPTSSSSRMCNFTANSATRWLGRRNSQAELSSI